METLSLLIEYLIQLINIVTVVISLYYLILSLFSIYIKRRRKVKNLERSFAILIPAHNEANVIKNTVESCNNLDYDRDKFDVFVVADNCSDNTGTIAKNAGASVLEPETTSESGKAWVLEWFFHKLFKMPKKYDSVLILDADNLIHPDFLKAINDKMNEGYEVVQGYLDSKNPFDSITTAFNSLEFWMTDRLGKLSRDNVGLSSQLGGTGFAVETHILEKFGWDPDCLAEDLEFTCKLCLNGYKVGWAHDAKIYDEKPLTLKQSLRQRTRWMQGYADVFSKYFFKLMGKAIKTRSFVMADCAIYTLQPVIFIMIGIRWGGAFLFDLIEFLQNGSGSLTRSISGGSYIFGLLVIGIYLIQTLLVPIVLKMDGKLNIKTIVTYLLYPLYSATWVPVAFVGMINKDKKEWVHTEHTRAISHEEIDFK
ncbi:MAG: glycosyltransferase family 2 protein [Clostridiaceae bacterium]